MDIDKEIKKLQNESFALRDETGKAFKVKPEGSLGVLALGYKGVVAWKKSIEK